MKVLFLKNVLHVWKEGEIKEVKSWYATNFLFPKNLAVKLTPEEERKLFAKKQKDEAHRLELVKKRHEIIDKLKWITLKFKLKTNWWKIFWSIREKDILDKIKKEYWIELYKRHIDMGPDWHLKKLWSKDVYIKLWEDSSAKITIIVE